MCPGKVQLRKKKLDFYLPSLLHLLHPPYSLYISYIWNRVHVCVGFVQCVCVCVWHTVCQHQLNSTIISNDDTSMHEYDPMLIITRSITVDTMPVVSACEPTDFDNQKLNFKLHDVFVYIIVCWHTCAESRCVIVNQNEIIVRLNSLFFFLQGSNGLCTIERVLNHVYHFIL